MAGRWINREVDQHKCDRPKYGESAAEPMKVGDEWQCDVCNAIHKVMQVEYGMQYDPIPKGYGVRWEVRPG